MSTEETRLYCRMLPTGSAQRSTSFARISFGENARSSVNPSADSLPLYSGIPEMHEVPRRFSSDLFFGQGGLP